MGNKRQLLSKFGTSRSGSVDEAMAYCDRRFRRTVGFRFTRDSGTLLRSAGPGFDEWQVSIVRSTGHEVTIEEESIALLVPYVGTISVDRGNLTSVAKPGSCILVEGGKRTTTLSEGYVGSIIQFPVAAMRKSGLADQVGRRQGRSLNRLETLTSPELVTASRVLVDDLDRQGAKWWGHDGPTTEFQSRVCDMISVLHGLEASASAGASTSIQHVLKAEEYMRARLDEDLSMVCLARELGVSVRSLQLAFRRHRGCSPKNVLTTLRLAEARKRLTDPRSDLSVSAVAAELGFYHFGRFAQAYRQVYGELPSQAVRWQSAPQRKRPSASSG